MKWASAIIGAVGAVSGAAVIIETGHTEAGVGIVLFAMITAVLTS